MAILTVIVGLVVGYIVIEEATRPTEPARLGLNQFAGQVSVAGTDAPAAPGVALSERVEPVSANASMPPATDDGVPSLSANDALVDAVAPGALQEPPALAGAEVSGDTLIAADERIEREPPSAIDQSVSLSEAGTLGAESPDRLVLSAQDTTIVARRYVDEAPVAGPEKPGLKLATRFASATRIVPFAFNRVGMGPEGEAAVKELVPIAMKAEKVHVRGRTDSKGAFEVNKQVALERAYTVREKFVEAGVPSEKMGISYCTECFIAGNDTEAGRRANRRVDVEFIMPADEVEALPETTYAKPLPESAQKLSFARSLGSMDRDAAN